MEYNLELEKVAKEIVKSKAKSVLLQLPDGLKPKAKNIKRYLEEHTKASIFIWLGTCYGACDTPTGVDKIIDLTVQWGHSKWV